MHPLIVFMRLIAPLPLRWVRALGWCLGHVLYMMARSRRHVVQVNLALCFPQWTTGQRNKVARDHMVMVMQSLLDRSWLWHGSLGQLQDRLKVGGDLAGLQAQGSVVLFAPHFVGLDAGGVALTLLQGLPMSSIYVPQKNPSLDAWVRKGRNRSGRNHLFFRRDGARQILTDLRQGGRLYLLPDMDFGPEESIFVPFFGVPAATLPSLSRFARLGRSRVVTVITRMTSTGYEIQVGAPWTDFPGPDIAQDTARMNCELEQAVHSVPAQYYWVHKRFKTRPPGEPGVY
jgi:KDO2-lipid IV(A) lauroyltransferase